MPQEDVSPARAQAYAQYVAPTLLGIARRAVDLAELEEGDSVLDVATGTGLAAFLAAERLGPEGTVIGLDSAPAMLAVAGERALGAGSPQIRWQEGDPARLAYADESFDAVLLLQSLFDLPPPGRRPGRAAPGAGGRGAPGADHLGLARGQRVG